MGLPDTRDFTPIPGASELPSATIAAIQDEIPRLWRAVRGGDFLLFDDFLGSAINPALWATSTNFAVPAAAAGVMGKVRGAPTAGVPAVLASVALDLTALDWRFACRLAKSVDDGLLAIGVTGANGGVLWGSSTVGNVQASAGPPAANGYPGGTYRSDIIAMPAGQALMELRCVAGVIHVLINGIEYSVAPAFPAAAIGYTPSAAKIWIALTKETAAAPTIDVDRVAFWAGRYSVGSSSPSGSHVEPFWAAVNDAGSGAGSDYVDVVFTTPFALATGANGYTTTVEIEISDAGPNVGYTIRNKTVNGFRIQFDAPFNGEVRGSAVA